MNKTRLTLPLAALAMLVLAGCRTAVPIDNVNTESYGSVIYAEANKLTLKDYEKAIVRAGAHRGWDIRPISAGQLEATNVVRDKHTVVVDVAFDRKTFSIDYKNSKNMDWNSRTKTIHPSYNAWVELLEADIKAEIQRLRAS